MKYLALLMTIIATSALISCIPTTDLGNPSLEETPRPLTTVSAKPADGIDTETHDLDVVMTAEPEDTLAAPTQSISKESEEIPVEPNTTEEISTMTPSKNDVPNPEKLPQVQTAVTDLAQRLNISEDEIEVVSFELKTWSDTSMGCPHPEMAYLQVPQDGALIQLSVNGQIYNYHSGGSRAPFLCEQPQKTVGAKPTPLNLEDFVPPPGNIDN